MVKLTKPFIDTVELPATDHVVYWDDAVKGYGLRVTSAGKKVFMVMGRVHGKSIQWTLGSYGVLTEDHARRKAKSVIQQMIDGIDPRAEKRAARAKKVEDEALGFTLRQLTDDYLARPDKLKERTKATIERHVVTTFKAWQPLPIVEITEVMCRARYKEIAEKGLHGTRAGGSPGQANQAFDILRAMLKYASRQFRRADGEPLIQRIPTDVLGDHKRKLKSRESRYIPKDKVGAVWNALTMSRAEARTNVERTSADLVKFLLLTGGRMEETASLEWSDVHIVDEIAECRWFLPEKKRKRGGDVWMPLSSHAVAILKARTKVEGNTHVFASVGKKGYLGQPRAMMENISELSGKHLSPHDIRRTFSNIAIGVCRIDKFSADLLTGHKPPNKDVTATHYLDKSNLSWLHPEAQTVGDWIAQQGQIAAAAMCESDNVVALRA